MIYFDKINVRESLEDFLKIEYTDGLQNEFNTMDALINKLKKDTLVGKYKTKSFALGVTDNIRMLGNGNDRYVLTADDYTNAAELLKLDLILLNLWEFLLLLMKLLLKELLMVQSSMC